MKRRDCPKCGEPVVGRTFLCHECHAERVFSRIATAEKNRQSTIEAKAEKLKKAWLAPGLSPQERRRVRYRHDPAFNVAERIRIQMRKRRRVRNLEYTLRKALVGKLTTRKIERFLGYTMRDLRAHLEAQFTEGMSWAVFATGAVHIDHKRPVASFDLDDPDHVRACWALTNLQPLWADDNMRKGCRLDLAA